MHDFCFTVPYGFLLVCGGLFGFLLKGSTASLGGGVGSGLLLIIAGYMSLKAFEKRKNSYLAFILETVCAALLTWVMGQRYMETSKFMPAGLIAGIRKWRITYYALMSAFYLYKLAIGGNHLPDKAK